MSAEYRDGRLMLAVRADGAKPVELALFEADPVIGDACTWIFRTRCPLTT